MWPASTDQTLPAKKSPTEHMALLPGSLWLILFCQMPSPVWGRFRRVWVSARLCVSFWADKRMGTIPAVKPTQSKNGTFCFSIVRKSSRLRRVIVPGAVNQLTYQCLSLHRGAGNGYHRVRAEKSSLSGPCASKPHSLHALPAWHKSLPTQPLRLPRETRSQRLQHLQTHLLLQNQTKYKFQMCRVLF